MLVLIIGPSEPFNRPVDDVITLQQTASHRQLSTIDRVAEIWIRITSWKSKHEATFSVDLWWEPSAIWTIWTLKLVHGNQGNQENESSEFQVRFCPCTITSRLANLWDVPGIHSFWEWSQQMLSTMLARYPLPNAHQGTHKILEVLQPGSTIAIWNAGPSGFMDYRCCEIGHFTVPCRALVARGPHRSKHLLW